MICALLIASFDGVELKGVEQLPVPARVRSLIRRDPVEYAMVTGREISGWQPAESKDWTGAGRGYLRFLVESPSDQVMLLNASGAGMMYVNGEPRVGDVYGYGTFFVPVLLRAGMNEVIASADRGPVTLNFREPRAELEISSMDATVPDFVDGRATSNLAAFVVHNNSGDFRRVSLRSAKGGSDENRWLAPYSTSKLPVEIDPARADGTVTLFEGYSLRGSLDYKLESKTSSASQRVTFRSDVDGSVQYYAVNRATQPQRNTPIVLSLHGASVEAIGQAQAYGPKEDFHLVAPTNRRPYGFNWEDIGRIDALETLEHAQRVFLNSRSDVFLTGHSMGGHGTWHLGAHYPDKFKAIAPCAGWISYDTYGGGANYDLNDPRQKMLQTMNAPSHTLLLKNNFANYFGIYIHHGDADDVVSPDQARTMYRELSPFGNVKMHLEKGGGHWFDNDPAPGADSVDWKPIFDMFRSYRPTDTTKPWSFTTVDPGISHTLRGFKILRQIAPREPSTLTVNQEKLTTQNVRVLQLPSGHGIKELDGRPLAPSKSNTYELKNQNWQATGKTEPSQETGFKAALHKNPGFALFTRGPKDHQDAAMQTARYLQEVSWYRANATPPLLINPRGGSPAIRIGTPQTTGIRRGVSGELVINKGLILASDAATLRFAARFPFYAPGVAMPDELRATPNMLEQGAAGLKHVAIWPR